MDEIRIEKIARAMALADSREMILATSDASELHHVSDGGWKDYRHMAIAALAEDAALSPPEPTEPCCPFCGRDPFHYVDNGVGMEAVAVTCCELGVELYRRTGDTVEMSRDDFVAIANRLRTMPLQDHARKLVPVSHRELPDAVIYAGADALKKMKPSIEYRHACCAAQAMWDAMVAAVPPVAAMVAEDGISGAKK